MALLPVVGIFAQSNDSLAGVSTRAVAGGSFTTFDVPGAGAGSFQGTYPLSINVNGAIAGYYLDGNNRYHGFVRGASGTITTFEAPDAGTGMDAGTHIQAMSNAAGMAGYYSDASRVNHGFLLTP